MPVERTFQSPQQGPRRRVHGAPPAARASSSRRSARSSSSTTSGRWSRDPGDNHDVRPHPHIGLATVTYLFEGAMMHRDNLGSVQRIEPGAINWMTAGRGIVHSERTPPDLRDSTYTAHGLQLWAALPQAFEESEPGFSHTPAEAIPVRDAAGTSRPRADRRRVRTALAGRDVRADAVSRRRDGSAGATSPYLPASATFERAVYAVDQPLVIDGSDVPPFTLAVLTPGTDATITAPQGARCVVIGGEPLDGPRFIWWNFVSSSKERIEQAKDDWTHQRMGRIEGEHEWIPLPP